MSVEYVPDAWVILKISGKTVGTRYKVLAGWYGGYLNGDSWRMNSGIKRIIEREDYYAVEGYSGSVYLCPKTAERLTNIMFSTYSGLEEQSKDLGIELEIVPIESILEMFNEVSS